MLTARASRFGEHRSPSLLTLGRQITCEHCGRDIPEGPTLTAHRAKCKKKMEQKRARAERIDSGGAAVATELDVEPAPAWFDDIFGTPSVPNDGMLHRLLRVLSAPEGTAMAPEVAVRLELLPRVLATIVKGEEQGDNGGKDGKAGAGQPQFWEGGTGYGTGGTESVWDREEWVKQQEREAQADVVTLKCVGALLRIFSHSNWSDSSTPAGCLSAAPPPPKDAAAIAEMLAQSPLSTRLLELMVTDSMVDLTKHRILYDAAVKLVAAIVDGPNPALIRAFEEQPKFASIIAALNKTAAALESIISRDEDKPFIELYRSTAERIEKFLKMQGDAEEEAPAVEGGADSGDSEYCSVLKKLQFGEAHFEVRFAPSRDVPDDSSY